MDKKQPKEITIRDLFPHFNEEQLKLAEGQLQDYLEVTIKIYEDLLQNPEAYRRFKALTAERKANRIQSKVNPDQV